ncbi:probable inactive DNA (cytosine-5)-methyltransferase DRM3 isoform X5 [Primulina eburnea]|uniref:probable inactive DNA (cytosine-5)-methyltransferase DRM3 isoform X5 n=1 Tax=Primulina eburnea TaxID=1245227 RepID=UPI003C6C409B
MNFLMEDVRFAMDKLGKGASIGQLMDFIFAARMARKYEKVARVSMSGDEDSNKVVKRLCKSLLIQFLVLNLLAVAQIRTSISLLL